MGFFTGTVYSEALNMDTQIGVILPQDSRFSRGLQPMPAGFEARRRPRALILLHGLTDNWAAWGCRSRILSHAEEFGVAVIMPEVQRSFYQDMAFGEAYFSYVSEELPALAAKLFNISTAPEDLLVAGLSMGGYGALRCGLTHPERYRAIGAFSAVTDMRRFTLSETRNETRGFDRLVKGMFGDPPVVPASAKLEPLAKAAAAGGGVPPVLMTCGTEDELYPDSENFFNYMKELGLPARLEAWPGIHEWSFWDRSVRMFLERHA